MHQLERALRAEQSLRRELETSELRVAELEAIETELGTEIAERDARLSELEAKLAAPPPAGDADVETVLRKRLAQREIQLSELRFTETELRDALHQGDARLQDVEAKLAERETRVAQLDAALTQLERQLAARDTSLREAETALAQSRTEAVTLEAARKPSAATAHDDLKRLRGIGPSFEKALHRAGVHTFEQVAAWSPEDIERIADQIGTNPRRILRNNWVAGAQEELQRKRDPR